MNSPRFLIVLFLCSTSFHSFSQKLKKGDKTIAANIQLHANYLADDKLKEKVAREVLAEEYIIRQFQKTGCKPLGDNSSWLQKFNIPDGREIAPASQFMIIGSELRLYDENFPFAFSASNKAEASIALELAESGVPWFINLEDLLDNQDNIKDTAALISARASRAASKGATALVIYNGSKINDLSFNEKDTIQTARIPVLYVTKSALKKHLSKESLDVKLNIEMKDKILVGRNIAGFSDNGSDSTVLIGAHFDNEKDVAALLELSRLLKGNQFKIWNYLFMVYSGEKKSADGIKYFNDHPVINLQKVNYTLNLDTIENKGLPAVKQSIFAINALKAHETKTRP